MSDDLDRRLREGLGDLPLPEAPRALHDAADRLEAEPLPSRPHGRRTLQAVPVLVVAVALVGALVWGAGARLAATPTSSPGASAQPSGPPPSSTTAPSPMPTPTPSPVTLARYPDGIPSSFDGQPVLRGAAILARAKAMTTTDSFLVGVWLDVYSGPRSCPIPTRSLPPDSWLQACQPGVFASDEAGSGTSVLVAAPASGDPTVTYRFASGLASGPAILRVHVHDPRASQCGPDEATCDAMLVVERAVWAGDAATAPRPISVEAAIAAVEQAAPGTGLLVLGDSGMGSWGLPRGGARLSPPYRSLDPNSADALVLAASVFPSVDALDRALPSITTGAAGALLPAAKAGEWGGSDPEHKWWFYNRWLVVENVAVLVCTLPTPSVADRTLLAKLADALDSATASPSP